MKKCLVIISLIILLLTACTKTLLPLNEIKLSNIGTEGEIIEEGIAYDVFDLRVFGFWNLTIKKAFLDQSLPQSPKYTIKINGTDFLFHENIYNPAILEINLPETIEKEEIESGIIKIVTEESVETRKDNSGITLENLVIQATEVENGTNLYTIETDNYLSMRSAGQALVYDANGVFIMPSYVESSEQNVYTVETFTEVKEGSPSKCVNDTFETLKDLANHEEKLSFIHPNGVKQEDGSIRITEPDQRQKFRQLGTMGPFDENHTYNIIKDEETAIITAYFNRSKLPETYDDTCLWENETKSGNKYEFTETTTPDVHKIEIPFTDTANTEIVKNARFDSIPCTGPMIELKTPENGTVNTDLSLPLTWEATPGSKITTEERVSPNIVAYQVFFAKNTEDYPDPEIVTEKTYPVEGLDYDTLYKWKVAAVQNDNQQVISQEFTFTTKMAEYNDPSITLQSPVNNLETTATECTFKWAAKVGTLKNTGERAVHITGYTFYLAKVGEAYGNGVQVNVNAYTVQTLEHNTVYKWQVKVHQSDGKTALSGERILKPVMGKVILFDKAGTIRAVCDNLDEAITSATTDDFNRIIIYENLETLGPINIDHKELLIEKDKPEIQAIVTGALIDRGFYITNDSSVTLDGLMITNSIANTTIASGYGGGIYAIHSSLFIKNTLISTSKTSGLGVGGGLFAEQSRVTLQQSTITFNESRMGGGIVLFNCTSAQITNCYIGSNQATEDNNGGGIVIQYNQTPAVIYSNQFKNNTGGGLVLQGSAILNSEGNEWRTFNAPEAAVEFVENTTINNNEYETNGTTEGADICWRLACLKKTNPGTLQIIPEEKEENQTVIMTVIFTTRGPHPDIGGSVDQPCSNASLTINVPAPFVIADQASVTIGDEASVNADSFTKTNNTITITGITATENTTVTLRLSESNVPPGCAARDWMARDTQYLFTVIPDADGSGTVWITPAHDDIVQATFTSVHISSITDIAFKQTVDYLKMTTNGATELLYDEGTTLGELIDNLQSTDGSTQTYEVITASGTLSLAEELPDEATLTVSSEWGPPYTHDYAIGSIVAKLETGGAISWHKCMQEAVDAASTTQPSTITIWKEIVKEGSEITINGKEMTITSKNPMIYTIDGNAMHRGFYITNGSSVTLSKINIVNCRIPDLVSYFVNGGGIYLDAGSHLMLNEVMVTNCSAIGAFGNAGGGVYVTNGTLTVLNSIISNNTALTGGGIAAVSSTLVLDDYSLIMANSAQSDSALFLSTMLPSIIRYCTFEANALPGGTGAIQLLHCPNITIHSNEIRNNIDGGIFIQGTTTVKNRDSLDWLAVDSPPFNIPLVENTSNGNNSYSGNGNWQGADINSDMM